MRLFPDYWEMEQAYYKKKNVWPIMHIIVMKKAVLDASSIRRCRVIRCRGCPPMLAR